MGGRPVLEEMRSSRSRDKVRDKVRAYLDQVEVACLELHWRQDRKNRQEAGRSLALRTCR